MRGFVDILIGIVLFITIVLVGGLLKAKVLNLSYTALVVGIILGVFAALVMPYVDKFLRYFGLIVTKLF